MLVAAAELRGAVVGEDLEEVVRLDGRVLSTVLFAPASVIAEGAVDVDADDAGAVPVGCSGAFRGGDGCAEYLHESLPGNIVGFTSPRYRAA
jgi:hypothetical protein